MKAPGPSVISEAEPFSNAVMNDYNAVKAAHPDDIVLFQMGDFFEMYGNDAETAAPMLGLNLTTRPVPGAGRVKMCGIPAHALEQYVKKLRDKYSVTISAVDAETHERGVYTLRSTGHEAERTAEAHEAEIGTDSTQNAASPPPQSAPDKEKLTELQEKALEIVKQYESLSIQDKINVIAQTFGCTTGAIETSPCTGKWRGTSDISIRFDNGVSLFLGNQSTPKAKTAKTQNEYVTAALTRYNPEIVSIIKEAALASLRKREVKDNEIAAQKGFKPYSLLNVEINDGTDPRSSGYFGWYYVTLAVNGKILTHLESGLAHDIASGKVGEVPTREKYFTAGGLKDADVDYIFNNVGFSSTVDMYSLPISDAARERAEDTLKMRESEQSATPAPEIGENAVGAETGRDTAGTSAPTIREQYEKYKPIVIAAVTEDIPYRNACGHSDRENAVIEGNAAVRRAVLHSGDMELIRLFSDVAEFRNRLHREVIGETYPQLHELLRPLSQDDIDEALQAWNGDLDSKRRVVRYMEAHGREKGAAEWLSREYGGAADKNLFFIRQGSPEMLELPWPKVQRRIAQLIKEDRFFTEQELDNFEDIDPAAIREQLESGEPSAFVEQVMADVEHIAAEEQTESAPAEPPDLSGQPITREGDTITIGSGEPSHEIDITLSDEEWQTLQKVIGAADQPPHDPLAPAYNVGDTVYLNDTAFEITDINLFDVQLRDPALPIPLMRSESKENFERLLRLDSRNGPITQYLPADLASFSDDFREVLTKHLLTDRDKDYISGWLRSGMNNRAIGSKLSLAFASRAETVTLETGDIADYRTSTISMSVEIQDKFGTNLAVSWEDIAPVLRALWLQELDGFSRAPVQREPVELDGKLSYQVGDKVAFAYGDHDVSGTIEGIGDLDIIIHTGPYAWSHQNVSKDFFEDAVRHDERNAHLFTQEPEPERPAPGPATIYPGDKNGLPFDIVVERLPVDGPEQTQAVAAPTVQNFHITDDHLGEGGLKEKFRRNLEAVTTLHEIEFDKRAATPAEQEILSRYVGWGALADAFDPKKPDWANEYKELQVVLTPEEYNSARASTLNAHYARFVP